MQLVLTAIGDDRAGLVEALSEVIATHSGNWERSQMAELAGKFAGIVVVSVPDDRVEQFTADLGSLRGLLDVAAYAGSESAAAPAQAFRIDVLGNDRPGIVREISAVLNRHNLSIDAIETLTREAPMAGGQLFEAHIEVRVPQGGDPSSIKADLERLASELLVYIEVGS